MPAGGSVKPFGTLEFCRFSGNFAGGGAQILGAGMARPRADRRSAGPEVLKTRLAGIFRMAWSMPRGAWLVDPAPGKR